MASTVFSEPREHLARIGIFTATTIVLVTALASNGGYFPGAWGWETLACAWGAAMILMIEGAFALTRAGALLVSALALLEGWTLLSVLWTRDVTQTALQAERSTVYVAGALAALLVSRRHAGTLLAALWASAVLVAGYALATRLLPDHLGTIDPTAGTRLSAPVGYWNGLGLVAALGIILALGLATYGSSAGVRFVAAASTVPAAGCLYFTFSRGAWIALGIGVLGAAMASGSLRLPAVTAALAIPVSLGVLACVYAHALGRSGASLTSMSHDGHRLAPVLVGVAVLAGIVGVAIGPLATRAGQPVALRWWGAALLAAVAVAWIAVGSPASLASRTWHSFSAPPPKANANLNARLFNLSGTGRVENWRVAWVVARRNPVIGAGASTYEQAWNFRRRITQKVRDAHNLYLETWAELGLVGLTILATALLLPLAALRRPRSELAAPAFGAFLAFLLHAAIDWDWELTAVTLLALGCGAILLNSAQGQPLAARRARPTALALCGVLAAGALFTVATRVALHREEAAAKRGNWPAAASAAKRASRIQPWSSEPWQALGETALAGGNFSLARTALERGVAKDRRNWELWFDLARASTGRLRAEALDTALVLNPRSPEARGFRKTLQSLSGIPSPSKP